MVGAIPEDEAVVFVDTLESVSVLDRTFLAVDKEDLAEEFVIADALLWLVPVLDRTVAAVDEENFAEKVVPVGEASRLCVGVFDSGSAVVSSGSWLIESSGSEGLLLCGFGGLLLLGSGGLSLVPGGPVELLQILKPTVVKNFNNSPPKLVGGLSHVGKSDSMSTGFP